MWRAVLAFSADAEVASDAVAEAFAQALGRGPAIRSPERWLWRTVFRIAAGELKERRQRGADRPEEAYEMDELARDLVGAPFQPCGGTRLRIDARPKHERRSRRRTFQAI